MQSLLESPIASSTPVLGVSLDGAHVAAVTVQGVGVYLQSVGEQKCVGSVSIPATRPLSCPALTAGGAVFAALTRPAELAFWQPGQLLFGARRTIPLPAPARALLRHNDTLVVVFPDGSFAVGLSGPAGPTLFPVTQLPLATFVVPGNGSGSNNAKGGNSAQGKGSKRSHDADATEAVVPSSVTWCHLVEQHKASVLQLLLFVQGRYFVYDLSAAASPALVRAHPIMYAGAPTDDSSVPPPAPCAACLQWPRTLFSLWSDGTLSRVELPSVPAASPGAVSIEPLYGAVFHRLGGLDTAPGSGASLAYASSTSLLLGAWCPSKQVSVLQVWDTVYGALMSEHVLVAPAHIGDVYGVDPGVATSVSVGGAGARCVSVQRVGGGGGGGGVTVCALHNAVIVTLAAPMPAPLLSGLLGRGAATQAALQAADPFADPVLTHSAPWRRAVSRKKLAAWSSDVKEVDVALVVLAQPLLSAASTPSLPLFAQAFAAYTAAASPVSAHFAPKIVNRILAETLFFAEEPLLHLIRTKLISCSACPDLVAVAIARNHAVLAEALVHYARDFDAPALLRLLAHFHTAHSEAFGALLQHALWRPWPEAGLVAALRAAPLAVVEAALQAVDAWLAHYADTALVPVAPSRHPARPGLHGAAPVPPLARLVDFAMAILDAKCTVLVLSSQSHTLLQDLFAKMHSHSLICDAMKTVDVALAQVLGQKEAPISAHVNAVALYSLEVLHL